MLQNVPLYISASGSRLKDQEESDSTFTFKCTIATKIIHILITQVILILFFLYATLDNPLHFN